jgi:hypothetical protein
MVESLKDIMEDIQKTKKIAELKPSTDVNVRRMQTGNIMQAKEKLKDLYMQYRKSVLANAVFMVAVGSLSSKLAKKSKKDFGTYSFSAEEMISSIVDQIPKPLYENKLGSRALFDHVMARFEERAMQIDIIGYTPILFKQEYKKIIKDKKELIDMLKDAFAKTVGLEVIGLDAIEKTSSIAVEEKFEGKVVPILLNTEDEEYALKLIKDLSRLSPKVILIKAGKTSSEYDTQFTIDTINDKNLKNLFLAIKENVM